MITNRTHSASINFINVTMNNINTLTDDIYEALIDQDYHSMNITIKELTSNLKELQKLSEHDI